MIATTLAWLALAAGPATIDDLTVEPREARLNGSDASAQIVVTGRTHEGGEVDLTDQVRYESADPRVAAVGPDGLIRPSGDGRSEITIRHGDRSATVAVEVADFANTRPVGFAAEVVPIFTKLGCNTGGCHGKASGQNGFKLSLLGFDPRFDYEALVREGRGRRLFPAAPDQSLLLLKTTARVPHGGGRKIKEDTPEYRTIRRWIAQGMPVDTGREPKLVRIAVSPSQRRLARQVPQQLRVTAEYSDGNTADVTRLAQYQSNALELATVDERGKLQTLENAGVASVMVRFGGQVTVARATIPLGSEAPSWEVPESANLIDPLLFGKLKELGIPPSGPCTDAEFLRRSALDICGVLPSLAEVAAFEADRDPEKRAKWVDRLLARPEYADLFAMKWSAILRNQRGLNFASQTPQITSFAFHAWIRQALAENRPYDRFVAEIVASRGDPAINPAVAWYRPREFNQFKVEDQVDDTAQLFLGMRIQCARCHHHPFERWGQDDYYGFASFFTRIGRKGGPDPGNPKLFVLAAGRATNPLTGQELPPKALDGPVFEKLGPRNDPRQALADWLGQKDNPFFAKALVNRYWKHFFGRGLVEPEDDIRVSNPPANPELFDALAADFVASGFDLKHLVRTICTSRAYGLSSLPNDFNKGDRQNFARYYPRRLPAEVLLDAIDVVCGTTEPFNGLPRGFRATQLPDEGFDSYFLEVFGRPKRESVCECERTAEANLSQRLHLLNSGDIESKLLNGSGRISKLIDDKRPDAEKVEELYRLCFSRPPTADEREVCLAHLAKRRAENKARQGFEDLVWTMINSKEFMFNK